MYVQLGVCLDERTVKGRIGLQNCESTSSYVPCLHQCVYTVLYSILALTMATQCCVCNIPPSHPLFQSSLEVIISQNDNALGVFRLTETNIALNDDDRSSVMVTISRTGGQLDGVTVCLQTLVHMM